MNFIEKRIAGLHALRPDLTGKNDLHQFWQDTIDEFANKPLHAELQPISSTLQATLVYELCYEGFDHTPIYGWYMLPELKEPKPLPCVVLFHGYAGRANYPEDHARFVQAGFAVLTVDIRGQMGRTGNRLPSEHGQSKGFFSQNILHKEDSYYRAIIVDALKALDFVAGRAEIDAARIAVTGGSQGGGLALAMGALSDKPCAIVADIPNLCHLDYSIYHSTGSLSEIANYCSHFPQHLEQVLDTLSYFDMLNLAHRITVPVMISVGLKDLVCPPETIFPVYHRISSETKELKIYPFIEHTVMSVQYQLGMEFLQKHTVSR